MKKILVILLLLLSLVAALFVWIVYYKQFPSRSAACIAVYSPVKAQNSKWPIIHRTFGNSCMVPDDWKIIEN